MVARIVMIARLLRLFPVTMTLATAPDSETEIPLQPLRISSTSTPTVSPIIVSDALSITVMDRSIVSHFPSLVIKCVNDEGYKSAMSITASGIGRTLGVVIEKRLSLLYSRIPMLPILMLTLLVVR